MDSQIIQAFQELKPILDYYSEEIVLLDNKYRIKAVNTAFCANYNCTEEEAIGSYCYKIIHNSENSCAFPGNICPLEEVLKTGLSNETFHTHYKNITPFHIEQFAFPIKTKNGIIRIIGKMGRKISKIKIKIHKSKEMPNELN